jgi:chromosome partitioning protein
VIKIPLINRKGSTTTVNLAAALAQADKLGLASRSYRTLLIDLDPQATASFALTGGRPDEGLHAGHVIMDRVHIEEAIRPTSTPGLFVLASCETFADEEETARLAQIDGIGTRLRAALKMLESPFDCILIDSPPTFGLPLTLAMVAGDRFILEPFALHGAAHLYRFIDRIIAFRQRSLDRMAAIMGVLLSDQDYQLADTAQREAEIRAEYGTAVFDTVIRRNVTIDRAQDRMRTIFQEDPRLRSAGAQCYRDLAAEVLIRSAVEGRVNSDELTPEVRLRGERLGVLEPASA